MPDTPRDVQTLLAELDSALAEAQRISEEIEALMHRQARSPFWPERRHVMSDRRRPERPRDKDRRNTAA